VTISARYYSEFDGEAFVIQAEAEAVENEATTLAVLQGIEDLLQHGTRVLLVFGKGTKFEEELRGTYAAEPHPETSRLVIPEAALPRLHEERSRIAASIDRICKARSIPSRLFAESEIQVERRIGHGSTGIPLKINVQGIRSVLEQRKLVILGFGGQDDCGRFLHVPSVSLAADLAVELGARKLLFLMHSDGISVPHHKGGRRRLSFADLEELLCLLQRTDERGRPIVSGEILPKVHASIRAVAGGVNQVHLVSYSRLLDEILTRTGVGTMIERCQSHHVDYARPEDLDEIERLHVESQRYTSPHGTPYVKPMDRAELNRLLPKTLLLRHRGVIVGKLHAAEVPGELDSFQIGGFVIGENHQDSQQGQLLLAEALARFPEQGSSRAVAITGSQRARDLFRRSGGVPIGSPTVESPLLQEALQRYAPQERNEVQLFEFLIK